MHGDRVVARVEGRRGRDNTEGRIIQVLERARTKVVGTLQRGKRFGFVVPDNRAWASTYVAEEDLKQAREGQKVVASVEDWGDGSKSPEGRIVEVLGDPSASGLDILSIIKTHELDQEFPEEVEKTAQGSCVRISRRRPNAGSISATRSCSRSTLTTPRTSDRRAVDRADRRRPLQVGIHIADVSHYVREADRSTRRRGSRHVGLPRRSRDPHASRAPRERPCSLKPDEERPAYSVISRWMRRRT